MSERHLATLCLSVGEDHSSAFPRRLDYLLATLPLADLELRLGLPHASPNLHYALGRLCPNGATWQHALLPHGVERFRGRAAWEASVACWCFPAALPVEATLRWLWCDLPVATDYLVWVEDTAALAADWWQELSSSLTSGADVFGPVTWRELSARDEETARLQPWYRGLPLPTQAGRRGVWASPGGWLAFRVACLRQAGLLETWLPRGGEEKSPRVFLWLGAAAQQLEWRHAGLSAAASPSCGADAASLLAGKSRD